MSFICGDCHQEHPVPNVTEDLGGTPCFDALLRGRDTLRADHEALRMSVESIVKHGGKLQAEIVELCAEIKDRAAERDKALLQIHNVMGSIQEALLAAATMPAGDIKTLDKIVGILLNADGVVAKTEKRNDDVRLEIIRKDACQVIRGDGLHCWLPLPCPTHDKET